MNDASCWCQWNVSFPICIHLYNKSEHPLVTPWSTATILLACTPMPPRLIGRDSRLFRLTSNNLFWELTVKSPWPFYSTTPVCLSVGVDGISLCISKRVRQTIFIDCVCCFSMFNLVCVCVGIQLPFKKKLNCIALFVAFWGGIYSVI